MFMDMVLLYALSHIWQLNVYGCDFLSLVLMTTVVKLMYMAMVLFLVLTVVRLMFMDILFHVLTVIIVNLILMDMIVLHHNCQVNAYGHDIITSLILTGGYG